MIKLTVQVIKAILTRSTQLIQQKSPYAELSVQGQINKTKVLINNGDMPEWNETIEYILSTGDWAILLQVQVKDSNNIQDSLIGEVTIDINPLNLEPVKGQKWHSLKFKKKPAGKVMLNISCVPYYLGYTSDITSNPQSNFAQITPTTTKNIRNPQNPPQFTSPVAKQTQPHDNSDSKVIRLNTSGRYSTQKQKQRSQINFSQPLDITKSFNIVKTNQTFYTGKRGVNHRGYSVERFDSNLVMSNHKSGVQIKEVPYYLKKKANLNMLSMNK